MTEQQDIEREERRIKAAEAEDLRVNPAFQRAVVSARKAAVDDLVKTEATDTDAIRKHQARIAAIDSLAAEIANEILRGREPRKTPGP